MPACRQHREGRGNRKAIETAVRRNSREAHAPHAFRAIPWRARKAEPRPAQQTLFQDEDRLPPAGRQDRHRGCRAASLSRRRHACGIRYRSRSRGIPQSSARCGEALLRPYSRQQGPRAWISTTKDRSAQCREGRKPDETVDPVASMLPNALPLDIVVRAGDSFIRTIRWRDRHCPPASMKLFPNYTDLPQWRDSFSS